MTDGADHRPAAAHLRDRLAGFSPRLGLVLGSGLGGLAELLAQPLSIDYAELPGFPRATVAGHHGRLVAGLLDGCPVLCLQGRLHHYEGHPGAALALPVRLLHAAGCRALLLTNAAGSLRPDMPPGSLMALSDHINWAGVNPLLGPNDDALGPRFFDMSRAYDPTLRERLHAAAARSGVSLREGVYVMYPGPNFETPAEIRALQRLGGDAVGMSTVPECLAANHCGLPVAAVSTITNYAAGLSAGTTELSHAETLAVGERTAERLAALVRAFLTLSADPADGQDDWQ